MSVKFSVCSLEYFKRLILLQQENCPKIYCVESVFLTEAVDFCFDEISSNLFLFDIFRLTDLVAKQCF